ncbi:hypothetical protein EVC26_001 [Rhizobium phage RHph_I72]|nr:hypothetical protein EVC13_001 [Rhizobium phage RHph_I65]QIG76447.1 hypothetical protein EVC26_001 [Rhizobium phage RHph_I72]
MVAKFHRTWIVTAGWAHPIWNQYAILLFDLKVEPPEKPPYIARPGMNYEFHLYALDPGAVITEVDATADWEPIKDEGLKLLQPANHAYQFFCPDDEKAQKWIQSLVDLIKARKLSPDTDWTRTWNEIFFQAGAVSLKR